MEEKEIFRTLSEILDAISSYDIGERMRIINRIREHIHKASPQVDPIDNVIWVSIDDVKANDYNPNKVANKEMGLLHKSISADGYTQPVVTIYDDKIKKYVIIDGFHRYSVCRLMEDI